MSDSAGHCDPIKAPTAPRRTILLGLVLIGVAPRRGQSQERTRTMTTTDQPPSHAGTGAAPYPCVGMWVTADGHIRHELLPNGRYDEARGNRKSAYQGRYIITGNHIDYVDDTGFTADGDFVDDVLHHAGMVLRRER